MCVKIFTDSDELSYDVEQPLETQLKNSTKVVINYEAEDPAIGKFLKEIERCTHQGVNLNLNLQVFHSAVLPAERNVNELIKLFAICFESVDKKLEDLNECIRKEDSVR
jgi:hypothetical protein